MAEYHESISKYRHMSSIEFIEQELGLKLLPYQKVLLTLYDIENWRKSKFGVLRPFTGFIEGEKDNND